jgi:hypothetical protein
VGDHGGFDTGLAQGSFCEPVEVGGQHDAYDACGGEPGDGVVGGRGPFASVFPLLLVGLEVGAQEYLALVRGAGEGGQECVVGGGPAEPFPVPGVRVADLLGLVRGGDTADEVLLDVPRGGHAGGDRGARAEEHGVGARRGVHGERELDVRFHHLHQQPPGIGTARCHSPVGLAHPPLYVRKTRSGVMYGSLSATLL